jgi:hypothetical protein
VKRLPVVAILFALAAPWACKSPAAPFDPYTPPGGLTASSWQNTGAHPAVVRVIAPERQSMSLGSGVLVGHSERLGLVVTNWHVVQDATGTIMVAFPNGFRSAARLLKTDRHWDLAALAIWRPENVAPVPLAGYMPRRGEPLTVAGYGGGQYRASTGRLVDYAAPATNFPYELLEVSTSARQGDSGGPIFNSRGEVAGVLFGTGGGSTMGSYCGRVRAFLMTVLPDFEQLDPEPVQVAAQSAVVPQPEPLRAQSAPTAIAQLPAVQPTSMPDPVPPVFETQASPQPVPPAASMARVVPRPPAHPMQVARAMPKPQPPAMRPVPGIAVAVPAAVVKPAVMPVTDAVAQAQPVTAEEPAESVTVSWSDLVGTTWAEQVKTALAAIGVLALLLSILRLLGEVDGSRDHKTAPSAKPVVKSAVRRTRRAA